MRGFRQSGNEQTWAAQCVGEVAFLRHKIPGLVHQESSDWDIAVRSENQAKSKLDELFGSPWLRIERPYVIQNYFSWGQVDFLPNFQWNGFCFLDPDRFWEGVRIDDDGLPRPRLAHDALVALLTSLLGNGVYRKRYDGLIKRALDEDRIEFEAALARTFGWEWSQRLVTLSLEENLEAAVPYYRKLRGSLKVHRLTAAPSSTMRSVSGHWVSEVKHHLSPSHPWVAFLGPDGSGKSSVIVELQKSLETSRLKTLVMHWRPKWSGAEPQSPQVVANPHGQKPRGFVLSSAALMLLWIRWMVGRFGKTWHRRAKQKMLVSDRYYLDLLVDPKRYRYGGSLGFAELLFYFLPKPNLTFILVAKPEILLDRKNEVTLKEAERQVEGYRHIADELRDRGEKVYLIDSGKKLEEVHKEVFSAICSEVFCSP